MAAVLEVMLRKARAGRLSALTFSAEEDGHLVDGVVGRFRGDPCRAIGALTVLKLKLTDIAAEKNPDFVDSDADT